MNYKPYYKPFSTVKLTKDDLVSDKLLDNPAAFLAKMAAMERMLRELEARSWDIHHKRPSLEDFFLNKHVPMGPTAWYTASHQSLPKNIGMSPPIKFPPPGSGTVSDKLVNYMYDTGLMPYSTPGPGIKLDPHCYIYPDPFPAGPNQWSNWGDDLTTLMDDMDNTGPEFTLDLNISPSLTVSIDKDSFSTFMTDYFEEATKNLMIPKSILDPQPPTIKGPSPIGQFFKKLTDAPIDPSKTSLYDSYKYQFMAYSSHESYNLHGFPKHSLMFAGIHDECRHCEDREFWLEFAKKVSYVELQGHVCRYCINACLKARITINRKLQLSRSDQEDWYYIHKPGCVVRPITPQTQVHHTIVPLKFLHLPNAFD